MCDSCAMQETLTEQKKKYDIHLQTLAKLEVIVILHVELVTNSRGHCLKKTGHFLRSFFLKKKKNATGSKIRKDGPNSE